jgi:hypothetical protein
MDNVDQGGTRRRTEYSPRRLLHEITSATLKPEFGILDLVTAPKASRKAETVCVLSDIVMSKLTALPSSAAGERTTFRSGAMRERRGRSGT